MYQTNPALAIIFANFVISQHKVEAEVIVSPPPIRPAEDAKSWGSTTEEEAKEEEAKGDDLKGPTGNNFSFLSDKGPQGPSILKSAERRQEPTHVVRFCSYQFICKRSASHK